MTTMASSATTDAELITTLESQVLQLVDHEAWLDAQIRELEYACDNDMTEPMEEDQTTEETKKALQQRIDILKHEFEVAASLEAIRSKVINRILSDAIKKRDEAVSEYLHIHKDLQTARHDLAEVQVQVLDLQDENRKLAQALAQEAAAIKEGASSQDATSNRRMTQRIEEELKTITIKYNVVSNVLQGLLLESGVDWSNDPHYLDVMLKLKPASD
ncbi:hypothetical protein FBU30_004849 [Linnemannia zychae]|nr:hypothetical protein FBU30_004849 [Linnemannia zychae]